MQYFIFFVFSEVSLPANPPKLVNNPQLLIVLCARQWRCFMITIGPIAIGPIAIENYISLPIPGALCLL
jgi:hypothetical protein